MIDVEHLTKRYGAVRAVDDVSFHCPPGAIMGFIGPNGAGKTTTMRVIAGLLRPTSGGARVEGLNVCTARAQVVARVGWMPDSFGVYARTSVEEYLAYFAAAFALGARQERRRRVAQVLELVDLDFKREADLAHLSKGMKQRVALARALLHDPRLLVLDEPAAGLDPRARIELREVFRGLRRLGKTLLVSSHILTELADFCDHVAIIEAGRLVFCGTTEAAVRQVAPYFDFRLRLASPCEPAVELLRTHPRIREAGPGPEPGVVLGRFDGLRDEVHELLTLLIGRGCRVLEFTEARINLEEVFLKITRGTLQ